LLVVADAVNVYSIGMEALIADLNAAQRVAVLNTLGNPAFPKKMLLCWL
jgi:hypothetical protein